MVFNTFNLRINICHPYIILTGILIGIFYFRILHVCSSSSRTNKLVHLYVDKLHLPPNFEGECSCDVSVSANRRSIFILYSSSVLASCGIEFKVLEYTYSCENDHSNTVEPFNRTTFRNTGNIDGSACLSISVDHNFPTTNATVAVTCHAVDTRPPTVSVSLPASSIITTVSSPEERQTTDVEHTAYSPTSSKETSMLTEASTRKVPPQIGDDESSDSEQIGIIAGAVGGSSAFLFIAIILIVCCYRKRRQKAKFVHDYINTTSDHEVTDNVVYNMEFPEDMKQPQIALNDMDTTYSTIDNDAYHHEKQTSSSVPYTNLQLDNDVGTYNTVDLDENHEEEKTPKPVKYNNLQISDDANAYNTVDCDENPSMQTETHNDSPVQSELDTDPSYDTPGHGQDSNTINKTNIPEAEWKLTANGTYAVVNKTKPKENIKDSDRPNQFQLTESGDTYAVVNKKSAT